MSGSTRSKPKRFRIGALEVMTGATRDAIHHYVELGILPPPEKTATTVAWYDRRHVEALERVRALRAAGVPLVRVARVMASLPPDAPVSEVARVGRLLAPRERSPLPVPRENLDAPTRRLADALGLADAPELDGGMRAALGELLALDPRTSALAVRRAAACVEALRPLQGAMASALFAGVGEDERFDDALARMEQGRHAVRAVLAAAWDQLERRSWEAALRAISAEALRAGPAAFLPLGASAVEGAALRVVVLESRTDLASWCERLRLTLGTAPAKRLGECARAALAAGIRDAWVELSLGVAHLDGGRYADARDDFARALTARPGWCLARAFSLAADALYHAARGTALDASTVPAALAAIRFDDEDELPARARALLVVAQTAAALPEVFGAGGLARSRCDAVISLLAAVPGEDLARATGELARIEGNALLLRAQLATRDGDGAMARSHLRRAATSSGAVARAARAALRALEGEGAGSQDPGGP